MVVRDKQILLESALGSTVGYDAVSRWYGKRVSIASLDNPEQHIVGLLQPDVGESSCRLTYFERGKVKVKYFDPDHLQVEDTTDGSPFLCAEREIVQKTFDPEYVKGSASLVARVALLSRKVFGPTSVYNTKKVYY